jgi:hypothetical protein
MGLAVCRRIVEQHGGSIAAKSQPGWGAVFTLTFPLAGRDGETAPPDTGSTTGNHQEKDGEVTA